MKVALNGVEVIYDNGIYHVIKDGYAWKGDALFNAHIVLKNERIVLFESAKAIDCELYESGLGKGIRCRYQNFAGVNFAFDTLVWIEKSTQDVFFEWICINEHGYDIKEINWPNAFCCDSEDGYTLIPYMQGVLLPNNWHYDWEPPAFNGCLCSSCAYMPWLAQVENNHGYIMINTTPWDARYTIEHAHDICGSRIAMSWLPSLNKMAYKRVLRFSFLNNCNHNTICKVYRNYAKETGLFTTLKEKALRNSKVEKLIGRMFVHTNIKTNINEKSVFFNHSDTQKNHQLTSFKKKIEQIQKWKQASANSLYIHLDGWGQLGYDNGHPDYLPACLEAGGYAGLKALADRIALNNDMLGLHDQYRDYYHNAKSYHRDNALQNADGGYEEHAHWAGGKQNYLCASLAKRYVKRNYETLLSQGIHPDAAYLDVFTCNELDECANPMHKMSRSECAQARNDCFEYLTSIGIIPSSEECSDWAMRTLVFAHYGPYEFMLKAEGSNRRGIPVPLFNLVYHECMILPWPMEKHQEDYMLYALLNGGTAYLIREAAYVNTDGVFVDNDLPLPEKIKRCEVVSSLHQKIAFEEMVAHEFIDHDYERQKTTFADGTTVSIDLKTGKYAIK